MNRQRIIISGATSFIGASLVETLSQSNCEIWAFVRKNSANLHRISEIQGINIIEGNLSNIDIIVNYVHQCDTFIHLAWDGVGSDGRKNPEIQSQNIINSLKAVEVAKKLGCKRFIFLGSQAEYGKQTSLTDERSHCNPVSEYGKAKLKFLTCAKNACENSDMEYIHLRIFSVFGYNDHDKSLVNTCLDCFENGGSIELGECSQLWNYIYIKDLTRIILEFILSPIKFNDYGNVFNVASRDTRPLKSFVDSIFNLSSQKGTYEFGIRQNNAEGAADLNPDITLVEKLFDWRAKYSFDDGINEIINCRRSK